MEPSMTPICKTLAPWGEHCVLWESDKVVYKLLVINPHCRTSLQKHEHRTETWRVLSGVGVHTGKTGTVAKLIIGTTIEIAQGEYHRIQALDEPLVILETWRGEDLREDDIVRLHDDYKRV